MFENHLPSLPPQLHDDFNLHLSAVMLLLRKDSNLLPPGDWLTHQILGTDLIAFVISILLGRSGHFQDISCITNNEDCHLEVCAENEDVKK